MEAEDCSSAEDYEMVENFENELEKNGLTSTDAPKAADSARPSSNESPQNGATKANTTQKSATQSLDE